MQNRAGKIAACVVFLIPLLSHNKWFWRYLLFQPGALTAETAFSFWRHIILPLGLTSLLLAASVGIGACVVKIIFQKTDLESPAPLVAFALGLGAISCGVFALGLAGGLTQVGLTAFSAATTLFAVWQARRAGALFSGWRSPEAGASGWPWILRGIMLYCLWHTLILALAPPTEWDILAYHLPIPKLYLAAGKIHEIPWLLHSHWPHLMEALYCLPLALKMDASAALLHWVCSWALVAAVFLAARSELGEKPALIAAALMAAQPTFLRIAGTAHCDGAMALFFFLGSWLLWRWKADRKLPWLIGAGLLGGLTASCKLFGIVPLVAWSGWIFWHEHKSGVRSAWKSAGLYFLCGFTVVLPWYVKTTLGAGNPIWPFFSGILGGRWGAEIVEVPYLVSIRWPWPPDWGLMVRYGPQYLLIPFIILGSMAKLRKVPLPEFLKFFSFPLVLYALVILRQQEAWRFFLPFIPVLAMAVGYWTAGFGAKSDWRRAISILLLGLGVSPALRSTAMNSSR